MNMNTDNNSYRPSMKGYQITNMIAICKRDGSSEAMELLRLLSPFAAKIEYGAKTAGYTPVPYKPRMNSMDSITDTPAIKIDYVALRKAAYDKWLLDANSCTMDELERALTHRRDNGLLDEVDAITPVAEADPWASLDEQMQMLDNRTKEQKEADLQEQRDVQSAGIT